MQCLAKELGTSSGKKRGQEVFISKTFKRFVQTADDERRSGECTSFTFLRNELNMPARLLAPLKFSSW